MTSDATTPEAGQSQSFAFETPSQVVSLGFVGVAEPGGSVDLFDAAGGLLDSRAIPVGGPGGRSTLDIQTDHVAAMDVHLAGGGALVDLSYVSPAGDPSVPLPPDMPSLDDIPMIEVAEDDDLAWDAPDDDPW